MHHGSVRAVCSTIGRFTGTGVLVLLVPLSAPAADKYWHVQTEGVTVVSDAGAKHTVQLAARALAFESTLRAIGDWEQGANPPRLVIYEIGPSDGQKLSRADGKSRNGRFTPSGQLFRTEDATVGILIRDRDNDLMLQSLLRSRAQYIVAGGHTPTFPRWYHAGLIGLFNSSDARADGTLNLDYGHTSQSPMGSKSLEKELGPVVSLSELLSADDHNSAVSNGFRFGETARDFSLFGLLTGDAHRKQYRALAAAMSHGTPAAEAVPQTFGISLAQLDAELAAGKWRKGMRYRWMAQEPAPAAPVAEALDDAALQDQWRSLAALKALRPIG